MKQRDDFAESTKRVMAERVAWRCSFPNCGKITIGPRKGDENKSMNLGEAAHITAASPEGPRYDFDSNKEDRRSIQNGIWMCRAHARFIDTDYKEYSADTLKIWKVQAEDQSYKNLQLQDNYQFEDRSTLIALGFNIFLYGLWQAVNQYSWTFEVISYLKGCRDDLREYADNFQAIDVNQRFISVESQGDARLIISPIQIQYQDSGKMLFTVRVAEKVVSVLPNSVGADLMLGDNGDLVCENGSLKLVSGIDAAIQKISMVAGTIYGEVFFDRTCGSFITQYYHDYKDNLPLLSKFIKLEFIRLSLLPRKSSDGVLINPPLSFIKQVSNVSIESVLLTRSRISLNITLIFGDGKKWQDKINVFIKDT